MLFQFVEILLAYLPNFRKPYDIHFQGNIRVFCRVRPLLSEEIKNNGNSDVIHHINFLDDRTLEVGKGGKIFLLREFVVNTYVMRILFIYLFIFLFFFFFFYFFFFLRNLKYPLVYYPHTYIALHHSHAKVTCNTHTPTHTKNTKLLTIPLRLLPR